MFGQYNNKSITIWKSCFLDYCWIKEAVPVTLPRDLFIYYNTCVRQRETGIEE